MNPPSFSVAPTHLGGKVLYCGRFAPSPSGRLHFGSLIAAVASYLDAKSQHGKWLVRIEDVDTLRTLPGATDDILRMLEGFGFAWDDAVMKQSDRLDYYEAALVYLQLNGESYPCACSQDEVIATSTGRSIDGTPRYAGTCRAGMKEGEAARSWRLKVPDQDAMFQDRIAGHCQQNLAREVGDFVLLGADGQYAYQLAVVVDDAAQGVNAVVRGVDMLDSTIRQHWLQERLGLPGVSYAHFPVVVNSQGQKISKNTRAKAVTPSETSECLAAALRFLGHAVPKELEQSPVKEFWEWAIPRWSIERVPKQRGVFPGDDFAAFL